MQKRKKSMRLSIDMRLRGVTPELTWYLEPEFGVGFGRQEHLKNIKETRRKMTAVRRKLEFQPVEGDITVEKKRETKTRRGRKLLDAMMV